MAERTATVRLRAVVDDYLRAIGKAEAATKGLTDADRFKRLGGHMEAVGSTLTRSVTLPLVAVAGIAGKMSVDFDRIFAQMQGLAGVAASEVDGLKDAVRDLAAETGRGPQELAEGLYFIRSAGIDGKAALDALEISARGAAAGLGETAVIADAVTSALGAYGEEAITAAEAGDVLAATAREGKAEADALAPQFGRLLPIASQLGVEFHEVGAGLAFLSRSGGGAELAATNLQNVLGKLLNPSEEGKKALEEMGMSAQDLRDQVREKGLLKALVDLRANLEANGMELGDFSRDMQFTVGALALTADEGERASGVFAALANSTGALGDAFDAAAETDGFKMQKALAEIQVALIDIGEIVIPIAATIGQFASGVAAAFSSLPEPAQQVVVALGAMLAAAGPLLSIGGKLAQNWQKIGDVISMAGGKLGVSATGMQKAGRFATIATKGLAGLLAAYVGLEIFADRRANKVGRELEEMFPDLDASDINSVKDALAGYRAELDRLDNREGKGKFFSVPIVDTDLFITKGDADRQERIDQLREKVGLLEQQERDLTDATLEASGSSREHAEALGLNADAAADAAGSLQDYIDKLTALFDPIFAMQDALSGEAEARDALNTAIAEHGASSREAAEAEEELFRAIVATDGAALMLQQAVESGAVSLDEAAVALDGWVASGRLTQEQADRIAEHIGLATSAAENYAGSYVASLELDVAPTINALATVEERIRALGSIRINPISGSASPPPRNDLTGTSALGGTIGWSGMRLVGERGPELAALSRGDMMFDANSTSRILGSGGGGGASIYLTVQAGPDTDGTRVGRDIVRTLQREVRARGGDVQKVLGA